MRVVHLLILLLILGIMSCTHQVDSLGAQSPVIPKKFVPVAQLTLKANKGTMYYRGTPFSGYATEVHENGQFAKKTAYFKGKKHGITQKWYADGTLGYQANYVANKRHGKAQSWWQNGVLRSEAHFEHAVADGIQRQWYRSGAKFKEIRLKQGREEGLQRAWRENGKIYINYEAKNGRIFGLKRSSLCFQLADEAVQYDDQ